MVNVLNWIAYDSTVKDITLNDITLHDITLNGMSLGVSVSPSKNEGNKLQKYNKYQILIKIDVA